MNPIAFESLTLQERGHARGGTFRYYDFAPWLRRFAGQFLPLHRSPRWRLRLTTPPA